MSWPPSSKPTYPGGEPTSLDTVCFSIYSDMSNLAMAFSSPNMASARALQSSVLPTPVGPRKMKEPMGLFRSLSPTLPRRMARAMADTASSWPTTRLCRVSSSRSSRWPSSSVSCDTGTPVHMATMSAMALSSTTLFLRSFSAVHWSRAFSSSSRSSFCWSRREAARSKSWLLTAAALSPSSSFILFSSSCRFSGAVKVRSRTLEAASSTRSMALSGRNLSEIYRAESFTAASMAPSVIFTLWWASYRSRSPESISTASSGVGSPTVTGWNRRSRAASFSICFLYSLMVVAPITWKSPRASAGFRILAASVEPSAEPAPIMVCSSSIKSITSPSRFTSSMADFMRSSKSPRYLVPATMPVRSREMSRFFFSISGTSPWLIFRASPSATAVLPTPGSPMSTGLFFVRRESICITRCISSERPMTGSILPSLAWAVRSRPNCSRAGPFLPPPRSPSWLPLWLTAPESSLATRSGSTPSIFRKRTA